MLVPRPLGQFVNFSWVTFGVPGGTGGPLAPPFLADQLTVSFCSTFTTDTPQIFSPSGNPMSDVRVGGGDSIFADKNKLTPSPQNYKIIISNIIN